MEYFKNFDPSKKLIREAFAAPRGSAKTTLISLILAIHKVCYGEEFLVILSSKDEFANDKVKDIFNELKENELLKKVFKVRLKIKTSQTDYLVETLGGKSRIKGQGIASQIRGIKFKEKRPTSFILDDIEHSDRVWSEAQREKSLKHFLADVTKAGDELTSIHFIGTILHRDSILSKLIYNPAYKTRIYKSIEAYPTRQDLWEEWKKIYLNLGDDERIEKADAFYSQNKALMDEGSRVFWKEKEDLLYLQKEKLEIGHRAFQSEKQNEPLSGEDVLFSHLNHFDVVTRDGVTGFLIEKYGEFIPIKDMEVYMSLDPAHGQSKTSSSRQGDFTSFVIAYKDPRERLFIFQDFTERIPPSRQIKRLFDLHSRFNFKKIGVEINLFRETFRESIKREKEDREKALGYELSPLPIEEIENCGKNKEMRIHGIEAQVNSGKVLFNKKGLSQEAKNELTDYPNTVNDDFLDALQMVYKIAITPVDRGVKVASF